MGSSKKKKKLAVNPARGFATTSFASKQKIEVLTECDSELETAAASLEIAAPKKTHASDDAAGPSKLQQDLSPEEYEKQLEESELQNLVEKHAAKSRREASRQASKLRTDRRLQRGLADRLQVSQWLPPNLLALIEDLSRADMRSGCSMENSNTKAKPKLLTEEEITIGMWTLQLTLRSLEYSNGSIDRALLHVLEAASITGSTNNAIKDSIWGIDEALDWLALNNDQPELSDYEVTPLRAALCQQSIDGARVFSPTCPPNLLEVLDEGISQADTQESLQKNIPDSSYPKISAQPVQVNTDQSQGNFPVALQQEQEAHDEEVSDIDSDLEPNDMVPIYLSTKIRLYEIQPSLTESNLASSRKPKKGKAAALTINTPLRTTTVKKLQDKIKKIESDILFDRDEADRQWLEKRIEIQQSNVSRKRLGLRQEVKLDAKQPSTNPEKTPPLSAESTSIKTQNSDTDDDAVLGALFDDTLQPSSLEGTNGYSVARDFGTWTGMSPRRVLEEACRARDSAAKITLHPISSGLHHRHTIDINWSKDQEIYLEALPISSITIASTSRSTIVSMVSISATTSLQSEAYVSTAALFLLFSSSPKEEKLFLRLPAIWRDLWQEFLEAKKVLADGADREAIKILRDIVREKKEIDEEEGVVFRRSIQKRNALLSGNNSVGDQPAKNGFIPANQSSVFFQNIWRHKCATPAYNRMLLYRKRLPMWSFRSRVLDAIKCNQVVIICGETGCGKSTQVPAYILENELSQGNPCLIYCTEPRRISAVSLARRVSEELGEEKQDIGTPRSIVGFAIRLESSLTKESRLVYATTGIVMRMLERSNDLAEITHLVLDEVHERSIDGDFLLIVLRKLMIRRPSLKVILMSATVDASRFSTYLDNAPVLNVPGRTFPVETKYLEDALELTGYTLVSGPMSTDRLMDIDDIDTQEPEIHPKTPKTLSQSLAGYSLKTRTTLSQLDEYRIDYSLITHLLQTIATHDDYIQYSKAILIFLPGIAEIRQLHDMLSGSPVFSQAWYIYSLHSTIASEDQQRAFEVPPPGIRKIVLATNIAETGITIEDVTAVIDIGKHKEMRFDERRQLSRLVESFISRANAKQRRGRAGRVQRGLCFHLFTKFRHDMLMTDQQTPEMLRLSLQDLVLRVKICKLGVIEDTLSEALDPPLPKNVRRAIDALVDVNALTASEELTPLGRQLARLPLDVHLGKLVLLGSVFKCLDMCVTVAAILSSKSPFTAPIGARKQADMARMAFKTGESDLLTMYNAYCSWRKVCSTAGASEFQFCRKNYLNPQTLANIEDLKQQLVVCIIDAGFLNISESGRALLNRARNSQKCRFFMLPDSCNINYEELMASSVIAWAFYPNLLYREGKGWRSVANNQSVSIHPTSVNKGNGSPRYMSFYHIMQSTNSFYNAHETSQADAFAIALLCGEAEFRMYSGVIVIDSNKLRFALPTASHMLAVKLLRTRLRAILARTFRDPEKALSSSLVKWLDIVREMFVYRESKQPGRH
ncbi:MAG: hypothetical protein M1829_005006 [Trizodia sp. TS-e1964]|nr:MAG: hypothetical protein M1829_005006 [Trizodia sp. TS-e1964]